MAWTSIVMNVDEKLISEIIDKFYMVQASDANFRFARRILSKKVKSVKNPDDAISDSLVWQRQEVHRGGGMNHLHQSKLSPSGVWIEAELKKRGIKFTRKFRFQFHGQKNPRFLSISYFLNLEWH